MSRPVRRTDPETSHEAAGGLHDLTDRQRAILVFMRMKGPMADHMLVANYQMAAKSMYGGWPTQTPQSIRTRRSELVAKGLVKDSGQRVRAPSGRGRAIVWEAVSGRDAAAADVAAAIRDARARSAQADAQEQPSLFDQVQDDEPVDRGGFDGS